MNIKKNNPLAEVFGFPTNNDSNKAKRYRSNKLCPFNNKVPECTKDKANNPLGVCSILNNSQPVITCPIRFREDWLIIENAAKFAFGDSVYRTSLSEIKLVDKNGQSAGNMDYVLIAYDEKGNLIDFASLEVQGVYITGNLRNPFDCFMQNLDTNFEWNTRCNYPKPDFLSSSRKRLIPQMLYKGGILKNWGKKQTVALQRSFFETLPDLPTVNEEDADIAWFLYDLVLNENTHEYNLTLVDVIYTEFEPALTKITTPVPGDMDDFIKRLQNRLDKRLGGYRPDTLSLIEVINE